MLPTLSFWCFSFFNCIAKSFVLSSKIHPYHTDDRAEGLAVHHRAGTPPKDEECVPRIWQQDWASAEEDTWTEQRNRPPEPSEEERRQRCGAISHRRRVLGHRQPLGGLGYSVCVWLWWWKCLWFSFLRCTVLVSKFVIICVSTPICIIIIYSIHAQLIWI